MNKADLRPECSRRHRQETIPDRVWKRLQSGLFATVMEWLTLGYMAFALIVIVACSVGAMVLLGTYLFDGWLS